MSFNQTYEEALAKKQARDARRPKGAAHSSLKRKPMKRGTKRLKAGKKTRAWDAVRAWLKPRFEKRGITQCEFGFILHDCWKDNGLSFAHSHKRTDPHFQMYAVALACPPAHQILDEVFSHDQMAIAVHRAIEAHGGMIKP
jgi:hypothetical protein